jgi:hypothetical protein
MGQFRGPKDEARQSRLILQSFYGSAYWHVAQPSAPRPDPPEGGRVERGGKDQYGDGPPKHGSLQNVRHEPKMNLQSASPLVQPMSLWCAEQQQL